MKKTYQTPSLYMVEIEEADIVVCSGSDEIPFGKDDEDPNNARTRQNSIWDDYS